MSKPSYNHPLLTLAESCREAMEGASITNTAREIMTVGTLGRVRTSVLRSTSCVATKYLLSLDVPVGQHKEMITQGRQSLGPPTRQASTNEDYVTDQ